MKWFNLLKKSKTDAAGFDAERRHENSMEEQTYIGAESRWTYGKKHLERARDLLTEEEGGSKKPVPKGAFITKPKPKQPQSKFADANPDKEPPNPFKKK